jgi:hypothetical protein
MAKIAWKWLMLFISLLGLAASPIMSVPDFWLRLPVGGNPTPSSAHALAYDSRRGILVKFGGVDDLGNTSNETWELDLRQRTWTLRTPVQSPPARSGARMTYDQARGVTTLFGGWDNDFTYLNDTWLWNGQGWTEVFPVNRPQARRNHGQAYDSIRGVVVMFGGIGLYPPGYFNDLWQWDGQNWSERPAANQPGARFGMALAYDSLRDALVLFGGAAIVGMYDDTWEWRDGDWTQRQPAASPPARVFPASGYSPNGGYTLMFGGQGEDFNIRGDTWLWDGLNWTRTALAYHPSARTSSNGVYIPPLRSIVLHGGLLWDQYTKLNDTWAFVGPPSCLPNCSEASYVTGWPPLDVQ